MNPPTPPPLSFRVNINDINIFHKIVYKTIPVNIPANREGGGGFEISDIPRRGEGGGLLKFGRPKISEKIEIPKFLRAL